MLCNSRSQFEDETYDYVMDYDVLCGYTDDLGNVVESETQPVCDSWADMCINNVPSVEYMCENIYDAPDAFFDTFNVEGMDAFDFCWGAQDYEDFDVEAFCAADSDFADVCIDGYPDFVKVCDTEFPPGTFDGSNYYQICELDFDDVCNTYPELCDLEAGTISSNVCSVYPEMCDMNSEEYNPCAANLYDCMMDPDFYLCYEFSELCGYETWDEEGFELSEPTPVPNGQTIKRGETHTTITCKAELYDSWYNIEALIDSANYFYNANITAGNSWEFEIKQGIRSYPQIDNVPSQIAEGDASLYLFVPELSIFFDYGEAEEVFDDIFGVDESTGHYDKMGEYYGWGEYLDESTNEYVYLYNHVEFGYQLPTEDDENTYIGIHFDTEVPTEYFLDGAEITSWVKYTFIDDMGVVVEEESYAVACIVTVGDPEATQVRFFENTFDIVNLDDAALEAIEVTPSDWELADWTEGWYDGEEIYDGMHKQPCVIF